MITIHLFLTVLALVFLLLAATRVPERYVSYGWMGMFLWLLTLLVKP